MLKLNNIKFAYNKKDLLYRGLNLNLIPGAIYGLLGKNGSGKSTLLKLMCGAIFPDSGEITLFNHDTTTRNKESLQEVFLLTDETSNSNLTGREYVNIYSELYPRFNRDKFASITEEFEVSHYNKLNALSEGTLKKFFIAFALATNCRLLLLDEPTNGLDIPSKHIFKKLVASAVDDTTSLVISTHQVHDLDGLVDPIIIIDQGKVLLNQTITNIEEKITFGVGVTPEKHNILYSTPTAAGITYAAINTKNHPYGTKVDLELLFNAVINNPELINKLFGA